MQSEQRRWTVDLGWTPARAVRDPQRVLVFGSPDHVSDARAIATLRDDYPTSLLFGCSTAGEIAGTARQR
jgi:hypothetical protein